MNDTAKINQAIRTCVRECFRSNAVLAMVAQYLDDLRKSRDWKASEVDSIEAGVRRLLKEMHCSEFREKRSKVATRKIA